MASDRDTNIVLYHYNGSPYARKIVWYLTLRQLQYAEVKQPMIMPRPDLQKIGVNYRRIPVMTIGRDVYCDTRIILRKLEELFPKGSIGAPTIDGQAIQKLLEIWHVEGPLFSKGAQCLPASFLQDPKFTKDREQMTGRSWNAQDTERAKPEAVAYLRSAFSFLEKLLADGRTWIVGTDQPSLADIEAIFVVHWTRDLPGALPQDLISRFTYPRVFAWMERFDNAVGTARRTAPKPTRMDGNNASRKIFDSQFAEREADIADSEPLTTVKKGDRVEVFPTDSGSKNKDQGVLLGLTEDEIVISLDNGLRLHTPRAGFRVRSSNSKL